MDDVSQALQEVTMGELPHGKEPKPFKGIAKKEKVGSTKEKLPLKPDTPEELCELYTPAAEHRRMFTPAEAAELRRMFTPAELRQMFTPDEFCQMFTPAECRRMFTPDEFYDMFTGTELRQMFTPDEFCDMFTGTELRQMFTYNELFEMLTTEQMSQLDFLKRGRPRLTKAETEAFYKRREAYYKDREVKYCGALEKGKKIIC